MPCVVVTLPPMFATTFHRPVRAALGVLFVLAACGGGEFASSIEVSLTEFAFNDAAWMVSAGEEFELTLNNDGSAVHNWSMVVPGSEITREGDLPEDPVERKGMYIFTDEVAAGASKTRRLIAPPPGTYQVICDIQAHFSAGMSGILTVEG